MQTFTKTNKAFLSLLTAAILMTSLFGCSNTDEMAECQKTCTQPTKSCNKDGQCVFDVAKAKAHCNSTCDAAEHSCTDKGKCEPDPTKKCKKTCTDPGKTCDASGQCVNKAILDCQKTCTDSGKMCDATGQCVNKATPDCQKTCTDPGKMCDASGQCVNKQPSGNQNCEAECPLNTSYCDTNKGKCVNNTTPCDPEKDEMGLVCVNGTWKHASDTCGSPCPDGTFCSLGACIELDGTYCDGSLKKQPCDGRFYMCEDDQCKKPQEARNKPKNRCPSGYKHTRMVPSEPKFECQPEPTVCPSSCPNGETCSDTTGFKCAKTSNPSSDNCSENPCQSTETCIKYNNGTKSCSSSNWCKFPIIYDAETLPLNQTTTLTGSFATDSNPLSEQINICGSIPPEHYQKYIPIKFFIPQSSSHKQVLINIKRGGSSSATSYNSEFKLFQYSNDACETDYTGNDKISRLEKAEKCLTGNNPDNQQYVLPANETNGTFYLFYAAKSTTTDWNLEITLTELGGDECSESACATTTGKIDQCILKDIQNPYSEPVPYHNLKRTFDCPTGVCRPKSGSTPAQCVGGTCSDPIVIDASSSVTSTFKKTYTIPPAAFVKNTTTEQPFSLTATCTDSSKLNGPILESVTFKIENLPANKTIIINGDGYDNLMHGGVTSYSSVIFHTSCNLDSCVRAYNSSDFRTTLAGESSSSATYTSSTKETLYITYLWHDVISLNKDLAQSAPFQIEIK